MCGENGRGGEGVGVGKEHHQFHSPPQRSFQPLFKFELCFGLILGDYVLTFGPNLVANVAPLLHIQYIIRLSWLGCVFACLCRILFAVSR